MGLAGEHGRLREYLGRRWREVLPNGPSLSSQAWADAFRSSPDLTGVVHIYEELKRKGVEFPMADLDALSPIHTPQRVSLQLAFSRKTYCRTGKPLPPPFCCSL